MLREVFRGYVHIIFLISLFFKYYLLSWSETDSESWEASLRSVSQAKWLIQNVFDLQLTERDILNFEKWSELQELSEFFGMRQ